jgi:16S rRNA (cytosine967-C5)-methyltransferase
LQLEPGQRVLDTCAAPGGKTTQILELQPDAKVVAVEIDFDRLKRVKENLQRLELTAKCIHADVTKTDEWWDGVLFDRILVDAPCSALGVIRRHPDIKLLRRQEDISAVTKTQARILNGVWKMLKPGGLLVYAVCSIFLEEGADVVQAFLTKHPDAKEDPLNVSWGRACAVGRQLLPGMGNMDGFYYARLKKC